MEVSAFKHIGTGGVSALGAGRSPLLRLQSDERLVGLVRRGHHGAFEVLVARYTTRLLAFCRHMLGSREDAEDVLQEVFAAAFNALQADDRPVNVRPWLYRIARNRSLNHLRRTPAIGVDSMDVHLAEHGISTADKVHRREEFRQLIVDVGTLAETQRSALLMREMDNLSYEQIAEAMETTIPSVKSLLVRARVGLAEAAEARMLTCEQVRFELGEVAEGLKKLTPPARRHLKGCDRCTAFRRQLQDTNKALAAVMPVGAVLLAKKLVLAHLGHTASGGGGAAAVGAAGGSAAGSTTGGLLSAGFGALGTKAAVGLTAAALVTAGAVEVQGTSHAPHRQPIATASAPSAHPAPAAPTHRIAPRALPPVVSHRAARATDHAPPRPLHRTTAPARATPAKAPMTQSKPATAKLPVAPAPPVAPHEGPAPPPPPTQLISDSTTVSASPAEGSGSRSGSGDGSSAGSSGSSGSGAPAQSGGSTGSGSGSPQGSGGGDSSGPGSGSGAAPVVGGPAPVPPPLP